MFRHCLHGREPESWLGNTENEVSDDGDDRSVDGDDRRGHIAGIQDADCW